MNDRRSTTGSGACTGGALFMTGDSRFGIFAVAWSRREDGIAVRRIFLPCDDPVPRVRAVFPGAAVGRDAEAAALAGDIERFLGGEPVDLSLDLLFLEGCGAFQRKVLPAEHAIPRGRVASYGGIAAAVGSPGAARAVGRALATNPFPVVVPCHRAVRADGGLGGFQGGPGMKRALLMQEGIEFSADGRVRDAVFFFPAAAGPAGSSAEGKR